MNNIKIEYELEGASVSTLARAAEELANELDRSGTLRSELAAIGIDAAQVETFAGFVSVEPAAHGLDAATVAAIVTLSLPFAKAGAKVTEMALLDVWKNVILPRLLLRFGKGSLTEKRTAAYAPAKKKPLPHPSQPKPKR